MSDDDVVALAASIEAAAVTTLGSLFAGSIVAKAPREVRALTATTLASHRACRDALNESAANPVLVAPDDVVARLGLAQADAAHDLAAVLAIAARVDDLLTQTCVQAVPKVEDPAVRALLAEVAAVSGRRLGALRTLAAIPPGVLSLALGPPVHPTVLADAVGAAGAATSFIGTGDALNPAAS